MRHRPFALHLRGAGSLSSTQVAGVDGDLDALHALAADVATACRDAGVELERRRYRPHVTVSRAPAARARLGGHVGSPWTVSSFDLVHSTLGKQVRHDVVQRFPLGG